MRTKLFTYLNLLFLMSFLSGCSSLTSPARKHQLANNTPYWFDYTANRRGAILIPKTNTSITYCSEPSPDAAIETIVKAGLTVAEKGEANVDLTQKIIQLSQRTQTILFLRESLYRLCELSANTNISDEEIIKQYALVIKAATDLASAEVINAETELSTQKLKALSVKKALNNKK